MWPRRLHRQPHTGSRAERKRLWRCFRGPQAAGGEALIAKGKATPMHKPSIVKKRQWPVRRSRATANPITYMGRSHGHRNSTPARISPNSNLATTSNAAAGVMPSVSNAWLPRKTTAKLPATVNAAPATPTDTGIREQCAPESDKGSRRVAVLLIAPSTNCNHWPVASIRGAVLRGTTTARIATSHRASSSESCISTVSGSRSRSIAALFEAPRSSEPIVSSETPRPFRRCDNGGCVSTGCA